MGDTHWPTRPTLPVAWGEVFDKLSILEIKLVRITSVEKLAHIRREYEAILEVVAPLERFPAELNEYRTRLKAINDQLWDIEDGKRACEARSEFGADFVELARNVYLYNDQRAEVKRRIDLLLGSDLSEQKSHPSYRTAPDEG